jgi:hypothetical protein
MSTPAAKPEVPHSDFIADRAFVTESAAAEIPAARDYDFFGDSHFSTE